MKLPSKIVKCTAVVVCISVLLLLSTVNNSDPKLEDFITNASQDSSIHTNSIVSVDSLSNASADSENGVAYPSTSNANWDDLRPLAKELSNYVGKNSHGYTSDPFSSNHAGCTGYDSSIVEQVSITFDNQTHTADAWKKNTGLRSDCSGGVSAMLFFMGVTGSGNKIDNNPSTTYKGIGTAISGTKFADLQPGDIIAKSGHVAMVVYKDTDKVYTFDWGSTDAINKCKDSGYAQEFDINADISTWRSGDEVARRLR